MVRYRGAEAQGTLALGEAWRVRLTTELLEQLEHLFGAGSVRIKYGIDKQPSSAALAH